MVFSDVKAGETITIDGKSKKPLLSQQISYFDDVYSVLSQDNMNGNTYSYKHKDMAAALYLGLCQICCSGRSNRRLRKNHREQVLGNFVWLSVHDCRSGGVSCFKLVICIKTTENFRRSGI